MVTDPTASLRSAVADRYTIERPLGQGGIPGGTPTPHRTLPSVHATPLASALGPFVLLAALLGGYPTAAVRAQVRVRYGVETPMRDGVKLVSDMWLPDGAGPFPTILVRTPYERTMELIPDNRPP